MRAARLVPGLLAAALLVVFAGADANARTSYFCTKSWKLTGDSLYLSGAKYHGIYKMPIRGPNGTTYKRALKFTVKEVRIKNMVQTAGPIRMAGRPGSTTTVTGGTITMYTERLKGKLLGVPVNFSPDFPPPITTPVLLLTDVEADNSALLNGDLTIPGAHLTVGADSR